MQIRFERTEGNLEIWRQVQLSVHRKKLLQQRERLGGLVFLYPIKKKQQVEDS